MSTTKAQICEDVALPDTGKHAAKIYMQTGLLRRACIRAFWPLFFVRLVTEVELEPLQLVLLGTVMELSILAFEIPTGVVADLYSRKWSVVISFFVMGIAIALSASAEAYWLLVVSQIIMGFGTTFESGAETAWITAELESADEAAPLIMKRASWQLLTAVLGIGLFSALAAATSLTVSLTVIGVIYAGWGMYLVAAMPENNFTRRAGQGWVGFVSMLSDGMRQCWRLPSLRILVLVVFVGGVAKEAIDRLDVQRLVDIGLPADLNEALVIGALVGTKSIFAAGALLIARRRAGGRAVVPAMAALLFGVALGIALLAHMELLALAGLGLILQGGFALATEPLVINWTNSFASSQARATVHSFMGQSEAFGEILGGIALGAIAQLTTVPTAMTVSSLLFVGAAFLTLTARKVWTPTEQSVAA